MGYQLPLFTPTGLTNGNIEMTDLTYPHNADRNMNFDDWPTAHLHSDTLLFQSPFQNY